MNNHEQDSEQERAKHRRKSPLHRHQMVEGPALSGHRVWHNDAHHVLIIDETVIPCTPIEYQLLMHLLEAKGYVTLTTLVQDVLESTLTRRTRHALTKYMSQVRAKVWPFDLDILCVTAHGYLLSQTLLPASN